MGIQVNPESIRNAANGLDKYIATDLISLADRMVQAYPIVWPGFGLALQPVEAYYNQVSLYHKENLCAGADAVKAMAKGLQRTAQNYLDAETVNVTNLLGVPPTGDSGVSYLTGLSRSTWTNTSGN